MSMQSQVGLLNIMCDAIALCEIDRTQLLPLSVCLRGALTSLPHVVGVAFLEQGPTWLVDMSRYRASTP